MKKRRLIIPLIALVVLAVVGVAGYMKFLPSDVKASTPKTASTRSQFSFAGAADWRQGPTNKTSMALFSKDSECFTSMEYKAGIVDVAAKLKKQKDDLVLGGGTMKAKATVATTLQTTADSQQYELHQFSLSGGGGEQLMGGLELGYVQLAHGYIEVQGHCNTASQLPTTVSALRAYRFDQSA